MAKKRKLYRITSSHWGGPDVIATSVAQAVQKWKQRVFKDLEDCDDPPKSWTAIEEPETVREISDDFIE